MTDKRLKWRPVLVATTAAVALIAMSCEAPRPEPVAPLEQKSAEPKRLVSPSDVLTESQVEKAVTAAPGFLAPRYPEILRQAGVEGEALVSFVVDEDGKADPATLEIIRSTHELFATAVKNALPAMRFNPAEVGGKKVKQLVQQPFSFSLPGSKVDASAESVTKPQIEVVVRRPGVPAEEPYVFVYAFDGTELARSEREANLLKKIEPSSIHSIEVVKGRACAPTCPLIKITLAKGKTLGSPQRIRLPQEEMLASSWEPKAETRVTTRYNLAAIMSEPHTVELLSSSGEVVARYGSRGEVKEINSEDISASEAYNGKSCKAGSACPLTRIWLKAGREAAYRKR